MIIFKCDRCETTSLSSEGGNSFSEPDGWGNLRLWGTAPAVPKGLDYDDPVYKELEEARDAWEEAHRINAYLCLDCLEALLVSVRVAMAVPWPTQEAPR